MILTRDKEVFRKFWRDEKENTPRFFNDASHTWTCSEEDFLGFCDNAERIYLIDDVALVYVERIGSHANVHLSLLRGHTVDVEKLRQVKDAILKDYDAVFGWCGTHNRGLRKILESCGLTFNGVKMYYGHSRNHLFEWQLFSCKKGN